MACHDQRSRPISPGDYNDARYFPFTLWARATLFVAGEFDLQVAIDVLQEDAKRSGLVKQFGQDVVQRLMADAFRSRRGTEPPSFNEVGRRSDRLPTSTVQVAE